MRPLLVFFCLALTAAAAVYAAPGLDFYISIISPTDYLPNANFLFIDLNQDDWASYENVSFIQIKSDCRDWMQRTNRLVQDEVDAVDGDGGDEVSDGDDGDEVSNGDDGDDVSDGDDDGGEVSDGDDEKNERVRKWDPNGCANVDKGTDKGAGRDNGFGSDYVWAGSLQSGLELASRHRRPVMLIIHKSWCGACRRLAPKFADSQDIQVLSKHFVLVNVIDEDEPEGNKYAPDGSYIPRILFLSPGGDVYEDIYNERGGEYRYFYNRPDDIAESMRRLLRQRDRFNH